MNATIDTVSSPTHSGGVNVFRGLMWRHWLAGRWAVMSGLTVLLIGGWALMLFHHPGWIIGAGSIFAMISGVVFGGLDAADGSEEFAFALPPTRSQRYLSGIFVGGGSVLAFCLIGTLSIALDLPQYAWSLVVDSGFTTPFGPWPEKYLYFLAVVIPLLVFACTHICASLSQTRGAVWFSWLPALIVTGLAAFLGCLAEEELWRDVNGYICIPSMLAMAAMGLLFGHNRYVRKEGVSRPGRSGSGGNTWSVFVVLAIVAVFAFTMSLFVARVAHDSSSYVEAVNEPAVPNGSAPTAPSPRSPTTAPTNAEAKRRQAEEARIIRARARATAQQAEADARAASRVAHDYSIVATVFPGVALLVVLLVLFLVMCRKRSFRGAPSRRLRKRHIVTRSVCAVLAITILASIGFFSWRQTTAVYALESTDLGTIRIPTKKAAPLTAEIKSHRHVELSEARLLINAVIMEATASDGFRAVRADEFDVTWRNGSSCEISKRLKLGDSTISYRMNISRVSVHRDEPSTEPEIEGNGYWSIRVDRGVGGGYSSSSQGVHMDDNVAIVDDIRTGSSYGNIKPLSTVPTVARYGQLLICVFVDLADADDKLAAVPVEQFLTERHNQIITRASRSGRSSSADWRWRVDPDAPLTANLIQHIGISSVLLALAAILLGQLFTRRGLATAAMLTLVVLYAAAIDRIALETHISHAKDAKAPLSERMIACKAAANTFFFARTASNGLSVLTDDRQNPALLRHRAERLSILLKAIAEIGKTGANLPRNWSAWNLRMNTPNEHIRKARRFKITAYYNRSGDTPALVVVRTFPDHLYRRRLTQQTLWTVVFSQVDATGRIVMLSPSLRATVIGDENDMNQAAWAARRNKLPNSDVWTRLILPAAAKLTQDQP